MRGIILGIALCVCLGATAARAADSRAWVVRALNAELDKPGPDFNRLASLTFPLAEGFQPEQAAVARVLDRVMAFLQRQEPACGQLPDVLLMAGFLAPTGRTLEIGPLEAAFRDCGTGTAPFDTANALLFFCRYTSEDHRQRVPDGVARLLKRQRQDGAFTGENGKLDFYLTTHAVLALHDCDAAPEALQRGQHWMVQALPHLARVGFLDGLAENLIFLDWMQVQVRDRRQILGWLARQANPDGGLCFELAKDCPSHWHATSLWLYLRDRSAAPPR
ncbi:hypothetical protein JCM17960_32920 [Magnetospira thiophila]